jgi:hypothetical protein
VKRRLILATGLASIGAAGLAKAGTANAAAAATPASGIPAGRYFTGDYLPDLSLYSFNLNLNAWLKGRRGTPPIDTPTAVTWTRSAGFEAVDITAYFIPGYDNYAMPTLPADQILQYATGLRTLAEQIGIVISGTGVLNDFADPNDARRTLDIARIKFWTDVAAAMGAAGIRVFSGTVPADLPTLGWEAITRARIVPALREVTAYAATKGVTVLLQNHGDMTATADQTIQIIEWVGDPNLAIIDDTGYFRPFLSDTGVGYPWYPDIAKVLPLSKSIQIKRKPGGQETTELTDFDRLFRNLRLADYQAYIPMEVLWVPTDPGYPRTLSTPPFDEISALLAQVKASLAATKTQPFTAIHQTLDQLVGAGEVDGPLREQLYSSIQLAGDHFRNGQAALAKGKLQNLLARLIAGGPQTVISDHARQLLVQKTTALIQSLTDVFG